MIVEGINCAHELLNANYPMEKVIINKELSKKLDNIIALANQKGVKIEYVDKKGIEKLTKSKNSQGVLCFVSAFKYCQVGDILKDAETKGHAPFIIILDGIVDPHNVGAIIRTAECVGVDGIIIAQNRACEINETVFKTSAGAVAHMKVAQVVNLSQTIEKLKSKNIWVYSLEAGNTSMYDTDLTGAIALVIGSEGEGVSRLVNRTCDGTISIPLNGKVNSLNASNAGAIAMYEALRQRKICRK
ncbi:MAG: 23S rRNA (guanosine(2251)-2'-O)-methyltransferase RlmB [Clostridia bacterium]|nr:23S rRNA (guanosine(2251)-2'-O)-methyltransferase RlmB [Clostridia bacterium]